MKTYALGMWSYISTVIYNIYMIWSMILMLCIKSETVKIPAFREIMISWADKCNVYSDGGWTSEGWLSYMATWIMFYTIHYDNVTSTPRIVQSTTCKVQASPLVRDSYWILVWKKEYFVKGNNVYNSTQHIWT